jgi:hypothetical protein
VRLLTPQRVRLLTPQRVRLLTPQRVRLLTPQRVRLLTPQRECGCSPHRESAAAHPTERVRLLTPQRVRLLTPQRVRLLTPQRERRREVANRGVRGFWVGDRSGAVTRRPPVSLYTVVLRTGCYAHDVEVWDLSVIQGPFSVAPCQTLTLRFATLSLYHLLDPHSARSHPKSLTLRFRGFSVCCRSGGEGGGGWRCALPPARACGGGRAVDSRQVRLCRYRFAPYRRLRIQGDKGRGRVRIQLHCTSIHSFTAQAYPCCYSKILLLIS